MNRKHVGLLFSLTLFLGVPVAGAEEPAAGEGFDARKAEITKSLDERITALQHDKECVQKAADQAALKGCRQERAQERKAFREKRRPKKFRQGSSNDN